MDKWGWEKGGSIKIFRRNCFYVTVPKNSVGEPFSVSLISGSEKVFASEGCQDFLSKIFCPRVPKQFVEQPFCAVFQKISGSQKILWICWGWERGKVVTIFCRNSLSHSAEKIPS